MEDCNKIEIAFDKERAKNIKLLEEFYKWLKESNLTEKTIKTHIENIDFYINEYLLYYDVIEAKDGVDEIDSFLGDWFIKKTLYSNKAEIKSNATSFKKFYTFMQDKNLIQDGKLEELKTTIKMYMPEWLENMENHTNIAHDDL